LALFIGDYSLPGNYHDFSADRPVLAKPDCGMIKLNPPLYLTEKRLSPVLPNWGQPLKLSF